MEKYRIVIFFTEIAKHPREGSGQPEQLKYFSGEVWSRKVNKKDRFVYEIFEEEIIITVIKALGHYGDK
jgi:toxin YoeB